MAALSTASDWGRLPAVTTPIRRLMRRFTWAMPMPTLWSLTRCKLRSDSWAHCNRRRRTLASSPVERLQHMNVFNPARVLLTLIFFLFTAASAWAQEAAFETKAAEAILIDARSGHVLFERNADVQIQPASMSKLMTMIMV